MRYMKAEYLLFRRTAMQRLLVIAPVCTVVFAFLSGGIMNVQGMALYWWYMFLLQGVIALFCALSSQQEKRAGNFYGVYTMPIDLKCYEFAKILVLIGKIIGAGIVLALLLAILYVIAPMVVVYQIGTLLWGSIGIVLISMWQIPLCLLLTRKIGFVFVVIGNTLIGLFTITMIGNTAFWFLWPYCWTAKFVEYQMHIGINGVMLEQKLQQSNIGNSLELLVASILLFMIVSYIDVKNFASKVGEES